MRVGIIQSNYIPWRGYFDFIKNVDVFVLYDDVQYTRRDWRNRNLIKTKDGLSWLTIPITKCSRDTKICDVEIANGDWIDEHLLKIEGAYCKAPYFKRYFSFFSDILGSTVKLSKLNERILKWVMEELHITTRVIQSTELNAVGNKTERLLDIVQKIGGTSYLSGPAAATYLDVELFQKSKIGLEYKMYNYAPYPQLHPPFEGGVTVLDLLFNTGPAAKEYLTSHTPNKIVLL